jgi:peptide/nickel transport system substrate-binding protein
MESRMESRSMGLSVILLVSLLVVGTLLLAACGGESTTTTAPSTQTSVTSPGETSTSQSAPGTSAPGSTEATGSTATSAAVTPKYGGTLRVAAVSIGANVGWPATFTAGGDQVQCYYETLLHSDEKGNLIPWLAESYKVADDQKSITFTLRKGVKFTDGSDLTADVVKWNLEQRVMSQPNWTSIEVVDPNTVRVNLKAWDNTIPASFGDSEPGLGMVSKAAYDKNGQDWITTHPVGTGPFTVASYVPDTTMKLVKNPNYWATDAEGNKLPYLDEIDYTFTADPMTTLMMAKAGEIDVVFSISPGKQMAGYEDLGWRVHPSYDANELWVPDSAHQDSPWSKQEVREAAEYAVDRVTIAEKFGYGYFQAPNQIPPRDTTAYDADFSLARNYDPAKAKQLLTQAGYPDGFKTTLIVWPGGNRDIALAEQQYLAAVGIQAEVEFADMGKWNSYVGPQGTYQNALLEGPAPAQGPTGLGCVNFALFLYGNNWQKPPEFMQALGAAISSPAPDVNLIRATTDVLTKNALLIPLYEIGGGRVEQPYVVADFGHRGIPAFSSLETAWLNK